MRLQGLQHKPNNHVLIENSNSKWISAITTKGDLLVPRYIRQFLVNRSLLQWPEQRRLADYLCMTLKNYVKYLEAL